MKKTLDIWSMVLYVQGVGKNNQEKEMKMKKEQAKKEWNAGEEFVLMDEYVEMVIPWGGQLTKGKRYTIERFDPFCNSPGVIFKDDGGDEDWVPLSRIIEPEQEEKEREEMKNFQVGQYVKVDVESLAEIFNLSHRHIAFTEDKKYKIVSIGDMPVSIDIMDDVGQLSSLGLRYIIPCDQEDEKEPSELLKAFFKDFIEEFDVRESEELSKIEKAFGIVYNGPDYSGSMTQEEIERVYEQMREEMSKQETQEYEVGDMVTLNWEEMEKYFAPMPGILSQVFTEGKQYKILVKISEPLRYRVENNYPGGSLFLPAKLIQGKVKESVKSAYVLQRENEQLKKALQDANKMEESWLQEISELREYQSVAERIEHALKMENSELKSELELADAALKGFNGKLLEFKAQLEEIIKERDILQQGVTRLTQENAELLNSRNEKEREREKYEKGMKFLAEQLQLEKQKADELAADIMAYSQRIAQLEDDVEWHRRVHEDLSNIIGHLRGENRRLKELEGVVKDFLGEKK